MAMRTLRSIIALPALFLLQAAAGCSAPSASVPAEIVNVPQNGCIAPAKSGCSSDKVFVKKEWIPADCKTLPIEGIGFRTCSASKIYRFAFPGRGTADMQSYTAILVGQERSIVTLYTKEIAGQIAGVMPVDEGTLIGGLQGTVETNGVVGRLGEDFEIQSQQRMLSNGKVISHTGDGFIYAYDAGIDHCKGFLAYGPPEWPGYLRRWVTQGSICDHRGQEVSVGDVMKLQSQLVFH